MNIELMTPLTNLKWTPPLSLCSSLPDRTSGEARLVCETYYRESLVGRRYTDFTLYVPDEVGLTLRDGWASILPCNEGTAFEGKDVLVQGYSMAQPVLDRNNIFAANAYGAVPASFEILYQGTAVEEDYRTPVLYGSSVRFTFRVTDSRGRVQTQTVSSTVYPYSNPTLSEIEIYRCASDGSADEGGMAVAVLARCGISGLGGLNTGFMRVRYRPMNGTYGAAAAVNDGERAVLWDGELSPRQTYEVWLQCVDAIGNTAQVTVIIPTDEAFFHGRSGGKGAAFGKYAEADNLLDVEWDLKTGGNLTVGGGITVGGKALWDYLMPVGYIYTSADPTSPAELFGGEWKQLKDVFLLAAGDTYAADSAGGAATVTLTEDQMPEHTHAVHTRTNYEKTGSTNGVCILLYGTKSENEAMYPAGGSQPHENMPPYVAKYMWQRVA